MKKEIIISGFGGQGGLAIGKNLPEAGMAMLSARLWKTRKLTSY